MLKDLIDRTGSDDIEDVDGLVVGFDRVSDSVILRVQLFDVETNAPLELWRVTGAGVEEFAIHPEGGSIATFNATHAAVRQYTAPHVQLFFTGAAATPELTAERLRSAHA